MDARVLQGLRMALKNRGYDTKVNDKTIEVFIEDTDNKIMDISLKDYFNRLINVCDYAHYDRIGKILHDVEESYYLYDKAPQLEYNGVVRYRLLSEFSDNVMAVRLLNNDTLEFVNWKSDPQRQNVFWGNYYTDYMAAKEDFAVRCGFIDKNRLFNETEMKLIREGLVSLPCNFPNLSAEQIKTIGKAVERIEMLVPEIQEHELLEENELVSDDELSL